MSRVLLSGYYGFANAGDEAVCESIIRDLKREMPDISIGVLSNNPEKTAQAYQVDGINRWELKTIWKELKKADLLVSGGGSLLQDVTSKRGFWYYLAIIMMARLRRKPVVIYAQGLGPLEGRFNRWLTGFILSKTQLITWRDEGSQQLYLSLKKHLPPAHVVTDPVLGFNECCDKVILNKTEGRPLLVVSLRPWKNISAQTFADVLAPLQDKMDIALLAMQKEVDGPFIKEVAQALPKPVEVLIDDFTTKELMGILRQADTIIGMRLHALIMGAAQKKPILAFSYDPKCRGFMKSLGSTSILDVEQLEANEVSSMVQRLLIEGPAYLENREALRKLAQWPAQMVKKNLEK